MMGNSKLARRPATDAELDERPADKIKVLIETRGQGGFVVVAPSHGPVHNSGKPYVMLSGSFAEIATISGAERDALYTVCRTLDELPETERPAAPDPLPATRFKKHNGKVGDSWIDAVLAHLSVTVTIDELLTRYGWAHDSDGGGYSYYTRPSKDDGVSGFVNSHDRFGVHTSATGFDNTAPPGGKQTTYDRLDIIAMYEYRDNRMEAARAIADTTGIYETFTAARAEVADQRLAHAVQHPAVVDDEDEDDDDVDGEQHLVEHVHAGEVLSGPDGFRYSDIGNSKRLLIAHGQHLRFVPTWNRWLAYAGGRWHLDHAETLVNHVAGQLGKELLSYRNFQDVRNGREPEREMKALIKWAKRSESMPGITSTVAAAATVPGVAVDHELLDANPWLFNVRNGTIDLTTNKLQPHRPGDLLTMQAAVNYEAFALAPLWEQLLARALPDEEVRRFVQRLLGLALVGEQLEHALAIALGSGANSKSTITRVIADVFGEYAVVASRDLLLALKHDTHPTTKASLFRRRFAHSGELPHGARLDEAQVKELTGGDRIKARRMREDEWEFAPSHLLWLHANHRPMIEGTDDGIWRRVLLIPFERADPRKRTGSPSRRADRHQRSTRRTTMDA